MKQYFAKYLPVEGEIKEGDPVITKAGEVVPYSHFNGAQHVLRRGAYQVPYFDNVQRAKLFLCSRDIQVGDGIKLEPLVSEPDYPINTEEEAAHWRNVKEAFKVIGEISSEAVWVKEGDEWIEEEVRERKQFNSPSIYWIKGPCGHFH